MAIHPDYPGLEAAVIVDSQRLKEYDNDGDAEPSTTVKYVEVTAAARFSVRYKVPQRLRGAHGVRCHVGVDGCLMGRFTHGDNRDPKDVKYEVDNFLSAKDGSLCSQRFRFAQLHTDEGDAGLDVEMKKRLEHVGEIVLEFSRVTEVPPAKPRRTQNFNKNLKLHAFDIVPEKNLKGEAKSHHASLDAPEIVGPHVANRVDYVSYSSAPFATFIFKYRSLAALKSLHVIPRTPSPPPIPTLPPQRAVGEMSRKELEAFVLAHQRRSPTAPEIKSETQGIKREAPAGELRAIKDEEDDVEVVSSKRLKRLPTRRDEVIVLD